MAWSLGRMSYISFKNNEWICFVVLWKLCLVRSELLIKYGLFLLVPQLTFLVFVQCTSPFLCFCPSHHFLFLYWYLTFNIFWYVRNQTRVGSKGVEPESNRNDAGFNFVLRLDLVWFFVSNRINFWLVRVLVLKRSGSCFEPNRGWVRALVRPWPTTMAGDGVVEFDDMSTWVSSTGSRFAVWVEIMMPPLLLIPYHDWDATVKSIVGERVCSLKHVALWQSNLRNPKTKPVNRSKTRSSSVFIDWNGTRGDLLLRATNREQAFLCNGIANANRRVAKPGSCLGHDILWIRSLLLRRMDGCCSTTWHRLHMHGSVPDALPTSIIE